MQYERVFQVLEYLPDGNKPTESPGWQSPKRPTFIRGSTAIAASVPACAKFETTFSGLRLLPWQEETPYPPEAVWLVQTPIDDPIGVVEEWIESPIPAPIPSTIVPPPLSVKAQKALDRKLNGVAHKPKRKRG